MKKRSPVGVFILSIVTFGIYDLYWLVKTKKELNQKTSIHTPTIWLLFAPFIVIILAAFALGFASGSSGSSNGSAIGLVILDVLAIFVILPISFYWFFKFSKAVNQYTSGKMSTGVSFLLLWLLHLIGVAIIQDVFNDMLDANTNVGTPAAVAPVGFGPNPAAPVAPLAPPASVLTPPTQVQSPNNGVVPSGVEPQTPPAPPESPIPTPPPTSGPVVS